MRASLMSAFSDDVLLTQLQRAAVFADEVRQIQSKSGKKFTGGNYLSSESQYAITKAATESAIVAGMSKAGDGTAARDLFERFEEMCRRRKLNIEADLRAALVKILAGELLANHSALGGSATRLISVNFLLRCCVSIMRTMFEWLSETPWVL